MNRVYECRGVATCGLAAGSRTGVPCGSQQCIGAEMRPPARRRELIPPAVFGAFDGVVTVLGAVFALSGNVHALIVTAVGLAAAGVVSMAGGEWLSDSEHGFGSSLVIGLTTGLGTLAPVLPYMLPFLHRDGQIFWSVYICLMIGLGITIVNCWSRPGLSLRRSAAQTYGVLLVAAGAAWLAAWATGAVG